MNPAPPSGAFFFCAGGWVAGWGHPPRYIFLALGGQARRRTRRAGQVEHWRVPARREFRRQAKTLQRRIVTVVNRPARHPAVQQIQDLFRQKADRLYHWARDPTIPAENNLAERELRPLVVARKVSFGSQSDRGAATRETMMTVLHTLRKRVSDPAAAFKAFLDCFADHPDADPFTLLFPAHRPKPP